MSLQFYKWLHFLGIFSLILSLGAMIALSALGGTKKRGVFMIFHGMGLVAILLSGFGMLARLGLTQGVPHWAYAKLLVWLLLGLSPMIIKRKGHQPVLLSLAVLTGALMAGYFGLFHS